MNANMPWVRPLFEALAEFIPVTMLLTKDLPHVLYQRQLKQYTIDSHQQINNHLWIYHIMTPWMNSHLTCNIFNPLWKYVFATAKRKMNVRKVIGVFTNPCYALFANKCSVNYKIYFLNDHFASYSAVNTRKVEQYEDILFNCCNLTLSISRLRIDEIETYHPDLANRLTYFPLATETDFLSSYPLTCPDILPEDIRSIPRPVVGCVGNLSNRIDFEFLYHLAANLPDASFVMIGSSIQDTVNQSDSFRRFRNLPNVYLQGTRPRKYLPQYIKSFNVALIPVRTDNSGKYACPGRLFDYLGSTRPILSTAIHEAMQFADYIKITSNANEAIPWLREVFKNGCDGKEKQRWLLSANHTWTTRAKELLTILKVKRMI